LKNRVKYRSRLQIIADILIAAGKGSRKTNIMFRCYLSHKVLCKYLENIVEAGLLRVQGSSECIYVTTEKGRTFLEQFSEYSERRRQLEQGINNVSNIEMSLEQMVSNCGRH